MTEVHTAADSNRDRVAAEILGGITGASEEHFAAFISTLDLASGGVGFDQLPDALPQKPPSTPPRVTV